MAEWKRLRFYREWFADTLVNAARKMLLEKI